MKRVFTFNWQNAAFDYEPYPICYIPQILSEADYRDLAGSYPPLELFRFMPDLGDKYSLAFRNNPRNYHAFLAKCPPWRDFVETLKSRAFLNEVFGFLESRNIDLGLKGYGHRHTARTRGPLSRLVNRPVLSTRMEFSVMRANGGHILPHTDAPGKIVTMVFSFVRPGEWDAAWGGGTDVLKPKDPALSYNQINRQLPFEAVDVVKTFPFTPNQGLMFVKTYNSLHSVQPMTGPESGLRKTVTINIESLR